MPKGLGLESGTLSNDAPRSQSRVSQNPALAASYESVLGESPPAFQTAQTPVSPISTIGAGHESMPSALPTAQALVSEIETYPERLVAIEKMMQWIYGNQLKLLEKMEKVMSDIGNVQERFESMKATINKLSDDYHHWLSETEALVDVNSLPIS
jgi:uncharacterized phage infection (PIP) family protein YhgE